MRYLTLPEILDLHAEIIVTTGGATGIRDLAALESSMSQPQATFGGLDLYPDIIAKAAAICFFIVSNHPFLDGNKRVGHAAMEVFLVLNGFEIDADLDEQEELMLTIAAGQLNRLNLEKWLRCHIANQSLSEKS